MRPDGFPQRLTFDGQPPVEAYSLRHYDDIDLPWTDELLEGELRITSKEGYQWLRSARLVHIFTEDPDEPGLISVSAARAEHTYTLVCRSSDAAPVHTAAEATGSPKLKALSGWQGIPNGWTVLSGYAPVRTPPEPLSVELRPLDPGMGVKIEFEGGLLIRPKVFARSRPPRISIRPLPTGVEITIGGQQAQFTAEAGWEAPGWDAPGHHLIDIVPGPSVTYEIVDDPWVQTGWEFWNAHPKRFDTTIAEPSAQAKICGACIQGPDGQAVIAAQTQQTLVALGAQSDAVRLYPRRDIPASVGFVSEPSAFLLSATGQRRYQGRVIWLGRLPTARRSRRADPEWVTAVHWATLRRLPLDGADASGEDAWREAKNRARNLRKSFK